MRPAVAPVAAASASAAPAAAAAYEPVHKHKVIPGIPGWLKYYTYHSPSWTLTFYLDQVYLAGSTHDFLSTSETIFGLLSPRGRTSYRHMSWWFQSARLDDLLMPSFWNLPSISATLLPSCLSNIGRIWRVFVRISRLQNFTRSWRRSAITLQGR